MKPQKVRLTSLALAMSLGLMGTIAGCGVNQNGGGEGGEGGEDGTKIESEYENGEGGEGGEGGEDGESGK